MALFVGFDGIWCTVAALALWGIGQGHNWVSRNGRSSGSDPGSLVGRVTAIDLCLLSLGGAGCACLLAWCAISSKTRLPVHGSPLVRLLSAGSIALL